MTGVSGPFSTEREARAAAHRVIPPEPGGSILSEDQNRCLILRACQAAGVELGTYDGRIVEWLAGFTDASCAVVAGLISRAHGGSPQRDVPAPREGGRADG